MKQLDKKILAAVEAAIRARNPVLADEYLRPGLSTKASTKRFRKLKGAIAPLNFLYEWHDGTKFVHLVPGETYATGIAKVSFIPKATYIFTDSEQSMAMMETWAEASRRKPGLIEGVNRYVPIFCGPYSQFMLDIEPAANSRIIFFDNERTPFYQLAYSSFDEFLADILLANITKEALGFFARQDGIPKW